MLFPVTQAGCKRPQETTPGASASPDHDAFTETKATLV